MIENIEKFFKKYGIYILISICLLLGLISLKFRNLTLDDDFYLLETSIMTEALKRGEWIGHYATGVHGFLFKLPVALIFLLTEPSLNIAVISNILIGCASIYLFYLILKKYFPNTLYPLGGVLLLFTNFQFLLHLPTYMREFPAVFSLLLLFYLLCEKKSYWLIGFSLLLTLDAKETVFFMILPGLLIYILISSWQGYTLQTLKLIIKKSLQVLIPSIIYLLLMLFTSVIPLNTVIFTLIPGVTEGGVEYQMKHFEMKAAVQSIARLKTPEAATVYTYLPFEEKGGNFFMRAFTLLIGYVGKLLYPRSFSFLSIPKILFFPALFTSIVMLKDYVKRKKNILVALALVMWSFVFVFVVRQSFDRYLFPITPVVVLFFLIFLRDIVKERRVYIWILIISSILSFLGLIFEPDYVIIKLVLNIVVIVLLILYLLINKKFPTIYFYVLVVIGALTFCVISFYYYTLGPLRQYMNFGVDYEVEKVVNQFDDEDIVLMNDPGWGLLINVYRGNLQYNPEWKWSLREWVPRKKNLRMFDDVNTYVIEKENSEEDMEMIERYGIDKVGIVVSNLKDVQFPFEDRLEEYMKSDMLKLEDTAGLKNKTVYIFKVIK